MQIWYQFYLAVICLFDTILNGRAVFIHCAFFKLFDGLFSK